jgi:hypothetical protein
MGVMSPILRVIVYVSVLCVALGTGACRKAQGQDALTNTVAPLVDHHQHLLSPAGAALQNAYILRDRLPYGVEQPVAGEQLVAMLDRAGIKRAVVLSDAYWFDSPARARALRDVGVHDIYAAVRAENDWTAREVALFSNRLESQSGMGETPRLQAKPSGGLGPNVGSIGGGTSRDATGPRCPAGRPPTPCASSARLAPRRSKTVDRRVRGAGGSRNVSSPSAAAEAPGSPRPIPDGRGAPTPVPGRRRGVAPACIDPGWRRCEKSTGTSSGDGQAPKGSVAVPAGSPEQPGRYRCSRRIQPGACARCARRSRDRYAPRGAQGSTQQRPHLFRAERRQRINARRVGRYVQTSAAHCECA